MAFQKHNTMKTTRLYTLFALLMVFAMSCNKPDEPNNGGNNGNNSNDVRVTTYTPQDITSMTAKCGGDVIVTQGLSLTELGVCWNMEQNPTVDNAHLSTTVWNEPFVCTITNLEPDTKYYVRAYALRGLEYYYGDEKSFTTEASGGVGVFNGHEYVDLGLPSGTLWATCNVGADKPEDYGDYYAWGETQTKEIYKWDTYKYGNGRINQLTKYCNNPEFGYNGFTDNLTILLPEDDVATANWGSGWCMPTADQWRELRDKTEHIWTVQNGVYGRLFTANNGNSLFLPAAGLWTSELGSMGSYGSCWSKSLYTDQPYGAYFFYYNSDDYSLTYTSRYVGRSIRPVRSAE